MKRVPQATIRQRRMGRRTKSKSGDLPIANTICSFRRKGENRRIVYTFSILPINAKTLLLQLQYCCVMNVFKYTWVFFFVVQVLYSQAQQTPVDTVKTLAPIEISTPFVRASNTGNRIQLLDSGILNRYWANNLGELLNAESDVYVKSYGLGTLATTSIRGGGSNHTAILWNGFNLQSPMYGPQDLSLVQVNFFNDIMVQYGSSGATWGSGAVGGAIHLNNNSVFNKGIVAAAGASFGSFADKQQHASIELSKKRFITNLKVGNHTAKNNFPFQNVNLPEKPLQKLTNAELKQVSIMNENYFQINEHQKINVRFWYQSADRNIPPSMSQVRNVSNQRDEAYRITSEWQRITEKLLLTARAAHFYETLIFDDPSSSMHSINQSHVTIVEAESKFKFTKVDMFSMTVNNTYSEAVASDGYIMNPHQNRIAFIAAYKIHNPKNSLSGFFNIRQELINPDNQEIDTIRVLPFKTAPVLMKAAHPLTYSIGGEGRFLKKITMNFSIAQHYRIPTFNDLYWAQGGNINLKPESGWGEELGINGKHQFNKLSAMLSCTVFNRTIDNWIIWTPTTFGYWSPDNIMKVWSRGAEYQLKLSYAVKKLKVQLNVMWNYTVSTTEKTSTPFEASVGKQLIYAPMYKGNANLTISYKNFSITCNQKYVGYTYTTPDHSEYLKPYLLSNINVSHLFTIAHFKLRVFGGVNNAFDHGYEVIQNRPMPGRNYQVGCSFYFNKNQ
jgi:vitamin B12 transporter